MRGWSGREDGGEQESGNNNSNNKARKPPETLWILMAGGNARRALSETAGERPFVSGSSSSAEEVDESAS